jgi:hypothetical protein
MPIHSVVLTLVIVTGKQKTIKRMKYFITGQKPDQNQFFKKPGFMGQIPFRGTGKNRRLGNKIFHLQRCDHVD